MVKAVRSFWIRSRSFLGMMDKEVRLGDLALLPADEVCICSVRKRAGPVRQETAEEIRLLLDEGTVPRVAAGHRVGHAPVLDGCPDKSFDFLDVKEDINPFLDIIVPAVVQRLDGYLGKVAAGKDNEEGLVVLGTDFL